MSSGAVDACYQRSSFILMCPGLEGEALNSKLFSRQLLDGEHALYVVIMHHLSVAVPLAFLSSRTK